jgi:hypothetical protein
MTLRCRLLPADQRCPFIADERREAAGLIVRLGRVDDLLPGLGIGCSPGAYALTNSGSMVPCAKLPINSSVAVVAPSPPCENSSNQRAPCLVWVMTGAPATKSVAKPIMSEWSATTSQSSGRPSFAGRPVDEVTCSPLAKR